MSTLATHPGASRRAYRLLAWVDCPPRSVLKNLSAIEASKRLAAYTAVDKHILPEHKYIGIGSGSTVPYVVERIVAQGAAVNKDRVFIPTGFQSKELIVDANLQLGDVDQYPTLDVTIDGADEVDADLNCIKGGGACHLREKVLAEAAITWVIVADFRKNSSVLGTTYKKGVPVEVAPFAYAKLLANLRMIGSPDAALRMAVNKAGPIVTDNGNFVIDAPFGPEYMKDPLTLLTRIKMLTGVVEVGLFCHMAKAAYFGNEDGSVTVRHNDGRVEEVQSTPDAPAVQDPSESYLSNKLSTAEIGNGHAV
ncbi:ribose-5-phosphate isomerase [Vararia minispora EC-137]|uniref:Ribose-5-phosphate isomerase n=1 Tax=Vararia minispora EC-137 TaxID=1314806 RepID=A0ACB8R0G7_9AGAM|nr:ribose-5-phosphate isomerase [Vararia minispora EC-137]